MNPRSSYKKSPSRQDLFLLRNMKWKQDNPLTKPKKRGPNAVHFAIPTDAVKGFKPLPEDQKPTTAKKAKPVATPPVEKPPFWERPKNKKLLERVLVGNEKSEFYKKILIDKLKQHNENNPDQLETMPPQLVSKAMGGAIKNLKPQTKGDSMTNVHRWLSDQKVELKPGYNMPDKMKAYLVLRTEKKPNNKHIKKALRFVEGVSMKIKPNTALEKVLIDAFNRHKKAGILTDKAEDPTTEGQ